MQTLQQSIDLPKLTSKVLDLAKQHGATAAEVSASRANGYSVSVRIGEVETLEHNNDKELEVTVYNGLKSGSASTSDFSDEALAMVVAKAVNFAKFTEEDACSGLADRELLAFNYPDCNLYHPWSCSPEQAIELAKECEAIALGEDKRLTNSEGVTINNHDYFSVYANSNGFVGFFPSTQHNISCSLIATDGHGMQRDHDYTIATDVNDLLDIVTLARRTAQRTVKRLDARRLTTRQSPVIFSANIARGLLGSFIAAISGSNLYRESSFLLNHLGQAIFSKFVQIEEQPHIAKALGSSPFDNEGVLTRNNHFIRDGILTSYVLGSYSARKLNMKTTANAGGVHNLKINHTGQTLAELISTMDKGLLVTDLMGQGTNIVTGDYSRGAFGYWIERGDIQFPVQEITIAGNLKDMFKQLIASGNDVDLRGNIHTGSLLIENMMIAGQ